MRLALTGRNLDITPALRQLVSRRLSKLDRLLNESIVSAQVVLSVEKHRHRTDVLVETRSGHALRGHGEDGSWQTSIGSALTKVEQQATRAKGRWVARTRRVGARRPTPGTDAAVPAETTPAAGARARTRKRVAAVDGDGPAPSRVVRVRRTSAKPMRIEDAVLRVDAEPGSVLVFRDAALDRVQVLVRRADGHIGLVDPDA